VLSLLSIAHRPSTMSRNPTMISIVPEKVIQPELSLLPISVVISPLSSRGRAFASPMPRSDTSHSVLTHTVARYKRLTVDNPPLPSGKGVAL
jgi:hypothetical protein